MKVLLATSNRGKVEEFTRLLRGTGVELIVPDRKVEIKEEGGSYLENALAKARTYYELYRMPTIADDSGLEVDSLGGYPGIFSSRFWSIEYGGVEKGADPPDARNIRKLLRLLKDRDRRARFVAVVAVHLGKCSIFSEGICRGIIIDRPSGEGGFGYDPIFVPEGSDRTMAELSPEEKDRVSHRGKAVRSVIECINRLGTVP